MKFSGVKTIGLSGKSGTGKSYNAIDIAGRLGIDAMIDDGLLIAGNRILEGESAKKQPTKIGAVKTALFMDDGHKDRVLATLARIQPAKILVIGTSEAMIQRIVERLGLPQPERIIQIEEITSPRQRSLARMNRKEAGTHIIPAPTFQVKRQFSGYFLDPMKRFRSGPGRTEATEKTVVRPTFSYLGDFIISDKVLSDIVRHVAEKTGQVASVLWVSSVKDNQGSLFVRVILQLKYGSKVRKVAAAIQQEAYDAIAGMTSFNMGSLDVEIRSLKRQLPAERR